MKGFSFRVIAAMVALVLIAAGCGQQEPSAPEHPETGAPTGSFSKLYKGAAGEDLKITSDALDAINVMLTKEGKEFRVAYAEYITAGEGNEVGQTIYARDVGNKQLTADFVPFDPRRAGWSGPVVGPTDNITYAIDQTGDAVPFLGGLTGAQTDAAISSAMATWNAEQCSDLPITRNPDFGLDLGFVAFLFGVGGGPYFVADVMHAGFRDIDFPIGILGVTYTFIWVGPGGPTDVDSNGKFDVAFREIYYDPS